MGKTFSWHETTTGWVMSVNGVNRWFIRLIESRYEIYEIVAAPSGCVLRDICYHLNSAKHRAYLIECEERNSRHGMVETTEGVSQ